MNLLFCAKGKRESVDEKRKRTENENERAPHESESSAKGEKKESRKVSLSFRRREKVLWRLKVRRIMN
jgi:hypothetical protein